LFSQSTKDNQYALSAPLLARLAELSSDSLNLFNVWCHYYS
jgi:hypothetical protein